MRLPSVLVFLCLLSSAVTGQIVRGTPHESVPDFLGWVEDEVVVVMVPQIARGLSVTVDGRSRPSVDDAEIQAVLELFEAASFRRQFATARPQPPDSPHPDLTGHYKLRFEASVPLDVVIQAWELLPEVDRVEPIGIHTL